MKFKPNELPPVKGLLKVGTLVIKPEGYPFPGEVRAVFTTKEGLWRYVVESSLAPGLMHIFAPVQIEEDEMGFHGDLGPDAEDAPCSAERRAARVKAAMFPPEMGPR